MKVIFLDIDGVMNSEVFYENRHKKRWLKPRTYYYLIRKFLGIKSKPVSYANHKTPDIYYTYEFQLKRLIGETCPQKWKWLSGKKKELIPEWWEDALVHFGFNEGTFVGITGRGFGMRGEEIQQWLDKNPEVEDYAILDDDSDMLPEQMDKFYHCDGYFGLSPKHLYRIGRAFDGESNYGKLNRTLIKQTKQ
jgi:hypothetical protein